MTMQQGSDTPFIMPPALQASSGNLFGVISTLTIALFFGTGLYLKTVKQPPAAEFDEKKMEMIKTQFLIAETKKPQPPKPKAQPEKKPETKEVVDLTKAPVLNQKADFTAPQTPQATTRTARPVYGLRRVFSTGLGAGGSASDAVIGKRGNTLDKDIDTLTPTKQDMKGQLVSITTVSTPPRLKHDVKPEYTKDMIAAKVEGVIKAELLVDIDGKVKEIKILNDLGFGTRERARDAFLQWEFDPAMRDNKPVATWITYSIRFVLLQE
jgi:outer membrane biosynthesis protein TonB